MKLIKELEGPCYAVGNGIRKKILLNDEILKDIEEEGLVFYEKQNKVESLLVEITSVCNMQCEYCYNEKESTTLTLKEFNKIDELFDLNGVYTVTLTGGEPTLNKEFKDIVLYLVSKDVNINVNTNLFSVSKEMLNFLLENKVNVRTSLDGVENKKRDSRLYGRIKPKIKYILDHEGCVNVATVYSYDAENDIDMLYKELQEYSNYNGFTKTLDINCNEITIENTKRYIKYFYKHFPRETNYSTKVNMCDTGEKFFYINSQLDLKYCPTIPFVICNLKNIDTIKLSDISIPECEQRKECEYSKECLGGCRSNSFSIYSSLEKCDKVVRGMITDGKE